MKLSPNPFAVAVLAAASLVYGCAPGEEVQIPPDASNPVSVEEATEFLVSVLPSADNRGIEIRNRHSISTYVMWSDAHIQQFTNEAFDAVRVYDATDEHCVEFRFLKPRQSFPSTTSYSCEDNVRITGADDPEVASRVTDALLSAGATPLPTTGN